ncbi:hypothetical protein P170DRAFT_462142 [Aspergillus steynii IBT 23096]|uniref:Poly A polymerase head domain-containing protein n=1 Tax=Aspergillus steynii IBT 23096 TaxID=1392250 RepID=A0A2I2GGT7_9EURO|nr:uncharacterized protein P170DRAFT_462142 [Aspergillus steynii IBT 23096]PLB52095.1 hypothetical protein P170DRAFT_462142 [Aspergillus steynii IBT 23096]
MDPNNHPLHYAHLKTAVETLITAVHSFQQKNPDKEIRIAIIGGLAVRHYIGATRETMDADVLITGVDTTECIKRSLQSQVIFPCAGDEIQVAVRGTFKKVDLIPERVLRPFPTTPTEFVPTSAVPIQSLVQPGHIPYLDEVELLLTKILSCLARSCPRKRRVDARDIDDLARHLTPTGTMTVTLTPIQTQVMVSGLPEFVQYSAFSLLWWRQTFSLP